MGIDGVNQRINPDLGEVFNPVQERALVYQNLKLMGKEPTEIKEIVEVFCGWDYRNDEEAITLAETTSREELLEMYKKFLREGDRGFQHGAADDYRSYFDVSGANL